MTKRRVLGFYRLGFSLLTFAALATIFTSSLRRESFNPVNFFSFFTIESNIFAATLMLFSGVAALRARDVRSLAMLRGAATLYMSMTGIIYFLLLRGLEASLQLPIPWVNTVLHYVMPLAVLGDWLLDPPRPAIRFRRSLVWLIYPLLYVVYSLVRGAATGWYPYPFLNVSVNGPGAVALSCAVMVPGVILLTWLLVSWTRVGRSRST